MGTCWTQCCVVFRREGSRILRAGGSSYFRSSTTGEHYTIEFENLVESDEEESPGRNHRVISEEEINHRRGHHYVAISDKQLVTEGKMKAELCFL
ncbi:AP-1 complex-associated regulatory protein-like isoform X1 [Arapaima gigas]